MSEARNLPDTVRPPVWAPEKLVAFRGKTDQQGKYRMLIVHLPVRRADPNPFPEKFQAEFASAFATKDAGLVWDVVEKQGIV